jgi:hypothetical protein
MSRLAKGRTVSELERKETGPVRTFRRFFMAI